MRREQSNDIPFCEISQFESTIVVVYVESLCSDQLQQQQWWWFPVKECCKHTSLFIDDLNKVY